MIRRVFDGYLFVVTAREKSAEKISYAIYKMILYVSVRADKADGSLGL